MLTADTITDAQIRDLAARIGPNLADLVSHALSDLSRQCKTCGVDIGTRCTNMSVTGYRPLKRSHPYRFEKQREARARCAEILNAWSGR